MNKIFISEKAFWDFDIAGFSDLSRGLTQNKSQNPEISKSEIVFSCYAFQFGSTRQHGQLRQ
jgi:hypothetical protein